MNKELHLNGLTLVLSSRQTMKLLLIQVKSFCILKFRVNKPNVDDIIPTF